MGCVSATAATHGGPDAPGQHTGVAACCGCCDGNGLRAFGCGWQGVRLPLKWGPRCCGRAAGRSLTRLEDSSGRRHVLPATCLGMRKNLAAVETLASCWLWAGVCLALRCASPRGVGRATVPYDPAYRCVRNGAAQNHVESPKRWEALQRCDGRPPPAGNPHQHPARRRTAETSAETRNLPLRPLL